MPSLIAQGADVNDCDFWLGPALNAAVLVGHLSIVRLLLKHGADPNFIGYLGPPIIVAVNRRDEKMVQLLLQNNRTNSNLTKRLSNGNAIYLACRAGDTAIACLLVNPRAKLKVQGKDLPSPLEAALFGGHETIAELILSRKDLWHGIITHPTIWDTQDRGRARMLRLLLDAMTAMHLDYTHECRWLLRTAVEIGQAHIVEVLLERPDNHPHHGSYTFCENTHLFVATMNGCYQVVRVLLQRPDIQPNMKLPISPTPLHAAIKKG